jgi:hypothetical protein
VILGLDLLCLFTLPIGALLFAHLIACAAVPIYLIAFQPFA